MNMNMEGECDAKVRARKWEGGCCAFEQNNVYEMLLVANVRKSK